MNGSPTCLFKSSRGLRQGDLLLSFLFTIVAEALGALFMNAKSIGLIEGFKVCRNGESISHLQFVDDTIFFASAKWEEVVSFKRILRCHLWAEN